MATLNQSVIPNQSFDLSNQCLIKPFKFSATSKKKVLMMKRSRGGARPGAGRISDRSKDLATHYTTEAVSESASKRLKCKHCDWHEQGVKLDWFEGHMQASHGNLLAPLKESIHKFVCPMDSTDLKNKMAALAIVRTYSAHRVAADPAVSVRLWETFTTDSSCCYHPWHPSNC